MVQYKEELNTVGEIPNAAVHSLVDWFNCFSRVASLNEIAEAISQAL